MFTDSQFINSGSLGLEVARTPSGGVFGITFNACVFEVNGGLNAHGSKSKL